MPSFSSNKTIQPQLNDAFCIREAECSDLDELMMIYASARRFMVAQGNSRQWVNAYPSRQQIADDIRRRHCYICESVSEKLLLAVFYFAVEEEVSYAFVEDGAWSYPTEPYGVVHRIASAGRCAGVGEHCLAWSLEQCPYLRIDTHPDNRPMLSLLSRLGFRYVGRIYLASGAMRLAFDKHL